jgi:hypothetical protein
VLAMTLLAEGAYIYRNVPVGPFSGGCVWLLTPAPGSGEHTTVIPPTRDLHHYLVLQADERLRAEAYQAVKCHLSGAER